MANAERKIDKAIDKKQEISKRYQVPVSSIVWMGGNKFAIVVNGAMQVIEF